MFINVKCGGCGEIIGRFLALDDNGGIIAECPKCKGPNEVYNSPLLDMFESPDDFEDPDEMTANLLDADEFKKDMNELKDELKEDE